MKRHPVRRTALLALAMLFLALAWVWDGLAAVARLLVDLIPWRRLKAVLAAAIDRLPAPLALLVFLVPFLIVEPLLFVATVAIALGYVVSGAIAPNAASNGSRSLSFHRSTPSTTMNRRPRAKVIALRLAATASGVAASPSNSSIPSAPLSVSARLRRRARRSDMRPWSSPWIR